MATGEIRVKVVVVEARLLGLPPSHPLNIRFPARKVRNNKKFIVAQMHMGI
jgi:hypothetical protein